MMSSQVCWFYHFFTLGLPTRKLHSPVNVQLNKTQSSTLETAAAIDQAIEKTGASSIRDMGKVMGELKGRYTGQLDFGKVGPMVKDRLSQ